MKYILGGNHCSKSCFLRHVRRAWVVRVVSLEVRARAGIQADQRAARARAAATTRPRAPRPRVPGLLPRAPGRPRLPPLIISSRASLVDRPLDSDTPNNNKDNNAAIPQSILPPSSCIHPILINDSIGLVRLHACTRPHERAASWPAGIDLQRAS